MHAWSSMLLLLHSTLMLCVVKMLLKGEVGGHALNTVNVLKFRTLKKIVFIAVRKFRNYVSEKILVYMHVRIW